jgi:hypothetical protein
MISAMEDPPSQEAVLRAFLGRIQAGCDRIISWVFEHGTLDQFPRVTEYLAKENGGLGWQDSYQNALVERLCASAWFARDARNPGLFRCTADDTWWRRDREEWRMNAFKERLFRHQPGAAPVASRPILGAAADLHPVFFSDDFFRTVGRDPPGARRIDLAGLARYLTELEDGSHATL